MTKSVAENSSITILPLPEQSKFDEYLYRPIRLKNGLTALLASGSHLDPKAKIGNLDENDKENKPELALAINVGAFDDPPQFQGMAHFLEHMVFEGTEKYPEEGGFRAFTTKHGGDYNAETDADVTVFFFSIAAEALKKGLERLADLITAPLLRVDSLRREKEAVDSEFRADFDSNYQRTRYIMKSLAKKNHPVTNFVCGNKQSLGGNPEELRAAMVEFWKKHYVANKMTLAVRSADHDLDTMQEWVVEFFGQAPAGNETKVKPDDVAESLKAPFDTDDFKKMYLVESVEDVKEVILTWSLPSMRDKYDTKPNLYMAKMFESERPGSIIHYLKKMNWATKIEIESGTDNGFVNNIYNFNFPLTVCLTDEGMRHKEEVIHAIFSFINMLKTQEPDKTFFEELQKIRKMEFDYISVSLKPKDVSVYMQKYPPHHFLNGDDLLFQFDQKSIAEFLSNFRHDNVNIMILDRDLDEGEFTHKEHWLQAPYSVQDIPRNWTASWEAAIPLDSFTMPEPNPYVPNDFQIYNPNVTDIHPKLIKQTEFGEVWLKREGKLPKAVIFVQLLSAAMIFISPQNACMFDLMTAVWNDELAAIRELAGATGLYLNVDVDHNGVNLKIAGYSQKLPMLLQNALQSWEGFENSNYSQHFQATKKLTLQGYINKMIGLSEVNTEIERSVISLNFISTYEKYKALEDISQMQFTSFSQQLRRRISFKIFIKGNMREDHAREVTQTLTNFLHTKPLVSGTYRRNHFAQLPVGETFVIAMAPRKESSNSIYVSNFFCGPLNMKESSIAEILEENLNDAAFEYLRTQHALGYSVSAAKSFSGNVINIYFSVENQEDKKNTTIVDKHVHELVHQFYDGLKSKSDQQFEEMKNSAKRKLKGKSRDWTEIRKNEYFFNRTDVKIQTIDNITLNETIAWYEKCLISKNHKRVLTVVVQGHVDKAAEGNGVDEPEVEEDFEIMTLNLIDPPVDINRKFTVVTDLEEFKKKLYYYPQRALGN